MSEKYLIKTEVFYRTIIERLFSEIKKEINNDDDRENLKELKKVINFFIYYFTYIFEQLWIKKMIDEGIFTSKIVIIYI